MATSAAVTLTRLSQSSLLSLPLSKRSLSVNSPTRLSLHPIRSSPHFHLQPRFVAAVSADKGGEEIELEVDIGGGEGGDGVGKVLGGGGGGGDDSSGEDEEKEEEKKSGMSMSQKLTLGYAALVGVGGVMGYMKSGSQKSLAAGVISSFLLYFVYTQLPSNPAFASSLGLGVSVALLAVMGSRFKKSGKIFPAGVVSLVSLVMVGGYSHGIMRGLHG